MKGIRYKLLAVGTLCVFACLCRPGLSAAEYPERPVTLICGFPAGEALDITARTIAEMAKKHLPQPIAVVNRPGAAGTIGTAEIIRSKADGYTIGITTVAALTVQPHRTKLPYGPADGYTPIMKLINNQVLLAVKSTSPWKNAGEFIAHAKANPGKIRVAHPGLGTILHLDMEQLKEAAKVDLTLVPFSGSAEAVPAVLGGHVDAVASHPPVVMPHVKAGNLRVIGVFEETRNRNFPEAQTFKELGYDITMGVYYAIIGPKDLPVPIQEKIHAALKKSMEEAQFVKMAEDRGFTVAYEGPDALKARLVREYKANAKFVDLLQKAGSKK
ncbi:MAG: tripartite tricarboxylate transporter substrate binding protein [Thermodesulfobacteriota bacterium]